ncbi:DUF4301 family protein [bacterium]|nr:DUF4301 family protein [bacterium]
MSASDWRPGDAEQVAARGLDMAEVERQLALLRDPPPPIRLVRNASKGDGVRVLGEHEKQACLAAWRTTASAGRWTSFVPASGAATRMFKSLLAARAGTRPVTLESLVERAAAGDADAKEMRGFAEGLGRLPFRGELARAVEARGTPGVAPGPGDDLGPWLDALLDAGALDYASLPKGLIPFHSYPDGSRTAFEEHLVESAGIVRDAGQTARLHFTVSPQHRRAFEDALARVRPSLERDLGVRFEVGFSEQSPSSDTVAIDADGRPFRDADGRLLFRPGGHGSLIGNVAALDADLLYVKNIDNVVPDHRRAVCVEWKRITGGLLTVIERRIHSVLGDLDRGGPGAVQRAFHLLVTELGQEVPRSLVENPGEEAARFARSKLDRPLRVCGVVRVTGDPGGGPFWCGEEEIASLQIVETAQINLQERMQRAIFSASTHFNPVDLACSLHDRNGRPFDLRAHVDPATAFVAEKSSGGRALRALEHPGLWNGAMSDWSTVFVDVPVETFNPVKSVVDLLRPAHQPPAG